MPLNNQSSSIPPWITPTLLNNWTNVSGVASCQYRKHLNFIEIKGLLQPVSGTMPASGSAALVLPVGYRPLETRHFAQYANVGGSFVMGVFRISSNGFCALFFPVGGINLFATEVVFIAEQ
jgi:hypothetical protein